MNTFVVRIYCGYAQGTPAQVYPRAAERLTQDYVSALARLGKEEGFEVIEATLRQDCENQFDRK